MKITDDHGVFLEQLEPRVLLSWAPPVGIPAPSFGIEQDVSMYVGKSYTFADGRGTTSYPISPVSGKPYTHFIDNTHSAATDSNNPYGTPSKPRRTIPTDLAAGSVVEVARGTYSYTNYQSTRVGMTGTGTADRPIFIRGASASSKPVFTREIAVRGSYMIVEQIKTTTAAGHLYVWNPSRHVAVRHSEATGVTGGGAVWAAVAKSASAGGGPSAYNDDIVFYGNLIHNNGFDGVNGPSKENGLHGIMVQGNSRRVWIVDNQIYNNGEDGIQIYYSSSNSADWASHVYIGRNVIHHNVENAVDVKESRNVIISENTMHGYRRFISSDGSAVVIQHGASNVWALNNHIYDSQMGIRASGAGSVYIVGNVIRDIRHFTSSYSPSSLWAVGAVVQVRGTPEAHVVSNTFYNYDTGVISPEEGNQRHHVINNVFLKRIQSQGWDIAYGGATTASQSTVSHNLIWPISSAPRLNRKSGGYINVDPRLTNPAGGDFRLRSDSPAIDVGTGASVYQTFQSRYGLNIARDYNGTTRPQNGKWDIGADEIGGSTTAPANRNPVAVNDSVTTAAGKAVTFNVLANDSDPDGDSLSIAGFTQPSSGTLVHNGNGSFTYTPAAGWSGTTGFNYTISDGKGGTASAAVAITVTAPVLAQPKVLYRLNAGGPTVGDWLQDKGFYNTGNAAKTSSSINMSGVGSGVPMSMFQTERWDPPGGAEMHYAFDVAPGRHEVRLYFAETYSKTMSVGARVFDVFIQGQKVLANYDVFAKAGGNKAVVETFTVNVTGSKLEVAFGHIKENPAVKGIEIIALDDSSSPTPVIGPTSYQVNAGGSLSGWESDAKYANTGNTFSTSQSINTSLVGSTVPMSLFQSERWSSPGGEQLKYNFAVEPGSYKVTLYFAEIYSGTMAAGKRVFDVFIQGQKVLANYDVYADVGGYKAVGKSFTVQADGNLEIAFGHVIENPAVKGIRIERLA